MDYNQLIQTVSFIVENDKVFKTGLTLVYELDSINHKQMNEHLFYLDNKNHNRPFVQTDIIEVEMGGVLVKFVKPKLEIEEK
jgi:hypothetical protein